jgi:hypothetical protein
LRNADCEKHFPGINDPSKEEEMKKVYEWAFIVTITRFLQPEFHLEMGTYLPLFDCINHV